MGKKYWGGYFPEQYPNNPVTTASEAPSSTSGVIPGVFYANDVRLFLDGEPYTSTIDPNRGTIYQGTNRPCRSNVRIWPRSLFNVSTQFPVSAAVECETSFLDFETQASYQLVDYGYGFKMYWEKKTPGTTVWVPVTSPPVLQTTKIRLGMSLWDDNAYISANGQYSTLRYSAINRYGTGATITIPPSNNTADGDTLALMLFNAATSGNSFGPVLTAPGRTTPTISSAGGLSLVTTNPPPGQQGSLSITGYIQWVTLTAAHFSRNTDDFTIEFYFRWSGNALYYFDHIGVVLDTRISSTDTGGEKNPDALAIQMFNKRLAVLRGDSYVIMDTEELPLNTWYHIILTCENRVWRLYKRPLPMGGAPANTATLVDKPYDGDHVGILRLRDNDLNVSNSGTKYRALVKYGALREKYSKEATLTVTVPQINSWAPKLDYLIDGAQDIPNARHLLVRDGTGYTLGTGQINLDVTITSNVSTNQFGYGWQFATQLLSDFEDGNGLFIGSPAPGGGGYNSQQVYNWIDNEAAAVLSGLKAEEYWAGQTPADPAIPAVPLIKWLPYKSGTKSPEDITFVFGAARFIAFRPYVVCGLQIFYGPPAFIENAAT